MRPRLERQWCICTRAKPDATRLIHNKKRLRPVISVEEFEQTRDVAVSHEVGLEIVDHAVE